ncbi:MAG: hypothetical protein BMS9Abin12_2234 [Acidimicrobiia bacterium]|nr:MAG: hypothetical protein BMS9Abin12_2234 [Acidimicrobiia bacterium]
MIVVLGYLDPGAGATLMQLVLAGTVGIGAIIKLKWHSIRSLFGRSRGVRDDSRDRMISELAAEDEERTS